MKKNNIFIGLVIILLVFGQGVFAQNGLISANELAKIINNKDVVVVSARNAADYNKVHIKGAVNIDIHGLQTKTPYDGKLASKSTIASILGKKGITKDKKIVLYCKTGVNAGRVYWILKYMGCKNVLILDGQMAAWRFAKKPVTKAVTSVSKTTFTPAVKSNILAVKSYVKSKINSSSTIIVDVRKKVEYDKGHIGKAVNIPYLSLLNESKIKSKETLRTIFNNAGAKSDKEIILYCKTGVTAGFAFFILKEILKYPKVKVYEGSYNEWKL
ncbi:MAG: sulfurtransferase [Bacteroidales bacterium]|nr:sulfurtransferase [Bacteroidales bacterium]